MNTIIYFRKKAESNSNWLFNRADEIIILSSMVAFFLTLGVFINTWF